MKEKERFHKKYRQLSNGCWEWTAQKDKDGYGVFSWEGYPMQAHRASWYLHRGNIPDKTLVCHTCDNPSCVNPNHLFLGTNSDNMKDMQKKGRSNYARGSSVGGAKLEEDDVRWIKKLSRKTYTNTRIAEMFEVSRATISYIRNGKTWKHV